MSFLEKKALSVRKNMPIERPILWNKYLKPLHLQTKSRQSAEDLFHQLHRIKPLLNNAKTSNPNTTRTINACTTLPIRLFV